MKVIRGGHCLDRRNFSSCACRDAERLSKKGKAGAFE